ncbi:hypothetical protein [Kineosporia sp. NBRC 101731]|uniref:hypothetical protein n=1 Tax=Kineosporia sp. NBRC 101731 TaxID=3032199 RepID=UPI0024A30142|nr:hypothetical protein [Kineosporia sp. NBRC 101731]GLY33564.1 hypothetical protein Kisp02_69290 [Kineosporia sp. NBRC 101731]
MQALTTNQRLALINRLHQLVKDKKIIWDPEEDSDYEFFATLEKFTYTLTCRDKDDSYPFSLEVYGREAQRTFDLINTEDESLPELMRTELRDLYMTVKKVTLAYENLTQQLFSELGLEAPPRVEDEKPPL